MEIMIIDDGVNVQFAQFEKLKHDIEVTETLEVIERKNYDKSLISHGSICAAIIKKYSPECEIGSIKILDTNKHNGSISQLLVSLEWCLNSGISLINMSFGTTNFRDYEPIRVMISKLIKNNCIIIAACHNQYFSLPSCLSGVIGVKADKFYCDLRYRYNNQYLDNADIYASSKHMFRTFDNKVMVTKVANSYAAPMITSSVYNLIHKRKVRKLVDIKKRLFRNINKNGSFSLCYSMRPDFIDTAIIVYWTIPTLIYESLFFCVDKLVDYKELKEQPLLVSNSNLIIIPPIKMEYQNQFDNSLISFLEINKSCVNGILYVGKTTMEFKNFCDRKLHCLLWDEEAFTRKRIFMNHTNINCVVPIILIKGMEDDIIKAAKLLSKVFLENGYNNMVLSNIKYSYLYGFEYIPAKDYKEIFTYYETYFNLSTMLFVSNTLEDYKADFTIYIYPGKEECMEKMNDAIKISSICYENKIDEIYDYIISCSDNNYHD